MTPRHLRQEVRVAHVTSGAAITWPRSGHGPPLLRTGHRMTHVEFDAVSALFRPWLERLGCSLTLVRYDERGSGLSGADSTPLGLDAAGEVIEVVMDAAGLARLSQLAVAFLQIGQFCACKYLIRKGAARANGCSEDFGRCGA